MVIVLTGLGLLYRAALYWFGVMQPIDFWLTLGISVWAVSMFAFLHWVTKGRGMGMGDVKFVFPLGLILGWLWYDLGRVSLVYYWSSYKSCAYRIWQRSLNKPFRLVHFWLLVLR